MDAPLQMRYRFSLQRLQVHRPGDTRRTGQNRFVMDYPIVRSKILDISNTPFYLTFLPRSQEFYLEHGLSRFVGLSLKFRILLLTAERAAEGFGA